MDYGALKLSFTNSPAKFVFLSQTGKKNSTIILSVSVFIIAFIRAPLIDINEIHELVSRSLLYGGKNDSNRLIIKECVAKGVSKSFLSLS